MCEVKTSKPKFNISKYKTLIYNTTMFSLTNWILGFSLSKLATTLIEKNNYKKFSDKLDDTVTKWAEDLPEDKSLQPSSIFQIHNEKNEHLSILKNKFIGKELPTKADWYEAIYAQWEQIKHEFEGSAQEFYQLENEVAKEHIFELSEKLYITCILEDDFFKFKVLNDLNEILTRISEINKYSQKSTIPTKLDSIKAINSSLEILKVFWPPSPLITKFTDDYNTLHEIAEKAILEIHNSYSIAVKYSDEYQITKDVKETRDALIECLNMYLNFVDIFYKNEIKKELDPKDVIIGAHYLGKIIDYWIKLLILIVEKLKIELEDE